VASLFRLCFGVYIAGIIFVSKKNSTVKAAKCCWLFAASFFIPERSRRSLYPDNVKIDLAAANRVAEAHKTAGLLAPSVDHKLLFDLSIVGS